MDTNDIIDINEHLLKIFNIVCHIAVTFLTRIEHEATVSTNP